MPNITVTVLFHWTLLLNTQLTNLEKRRIICIFFFGWFKEFVEAHVLCHTQVVILLLCLLFYWAQFVNHFVNIPFIVLTKLTHGTLVYSSLYFMVCRLSYI